GDGGFERPLRRERADVQLVDDEVFEGRRLERIARGQLEDPGGPPKAVRLPARGRIRQRPTIKHKQVVVPRASGGDYLIKPVAGRLHGGVGVAEPQRYRGGVRRPDLKSPHSGTSQIAAS